MTNSNITDGLQRRATIEDVAAGAGVSVATVSRALRGLPNVAEATRARVSAVATELAYQPDPAAARLAAGRTGTVTLAVPSLNGWYFSTVVAGAEAVCAEAGLEFQVIGVGTAEQRDRLFAEAYRLERRTDGLILLDIAVSDEQAASLRQRRVGLATIGRRMAGHPSVAIDDDQVGRLAAEHLLGLGHQRIGVIGGAANGPMSFDAPVTRRHGFETALAEQGVSLPAALFTTGDFNIEGGYDAMSTLIAGPTPPTAVFAMSDEMAFGALMALDEHMLEPGVDMSIMGVDDHEFAQVVDLTTIRQPVAEHGSTAARMLIEGLTRATSGVEHPPVAAADIEIQPGVALVERSTTGPPRSRR